MPGTALAEQLYRSAAAQGHGRDGTHALILALAEMSGIKWEQDDRAVGVRPACGG